ncbi:hypothetical protein Btru_019841 [Bulinus truncatus]|nr:hypothetical protein Btru_019841 [Bulinus truncatus]
MSSKYSKNGSVPNQSPHDGGKPALSQTFRSLSSKTMKRSVRSKRRSSKYEGDTSSRRRVRCKSLGPPKCAQNFHLSPLAHSSTYVDYGSCSDKNFGKQDPYISKPDPYRELHTEVLAIVKKTLYQQQATTPSYRLDRLGEFDYKSVVGSAEINGPGRDCTAKGDDQDDDDDDDEEDGIPQAVRATLPHQEPTTTFEISKALHLNRMEKIARAVNPQNLLSHLSTLGYLNHHYSQHMRSSLDQQNLKFGLKKGVERLYSALPSYSI